MTESDINKFMDLLVDSCNIREEYTVLENKNAVIYMDGDSTKEKELINDALINILTNTEVKSEEDDILNDAEYNNVQKGKRMNRKSNETPKIDRIIKRENNFDDSKDNNDTANLKNAKDVDDTTLRESKQTSLEMVNSKDNKKELGIDFLFNIGDLKEKKLEGPEFIFDTNYWLKIENLW